MSIVRSHIPNLYQAIEALYGANTVGTANIWRVESIQGFDVAGPVKQYALVVNIVAAGALAFVPVMAVRASTGAFTLTPGTGVASMILAMAANVTAVAAATPIASQVVQWGDTTF